LDEGQDLSPVQEILGHKSQHMIRRYAKWTAKKDGCITVLGLADYIEEHVIKLSEEIFKRQQTPTIQTGANFPIGKVK
jgi:hypothetical protein